MTTSQAISSPALGNEFKNAISQKTSKKRPAPLSIRLSEEQWIQFRKDSVGMSMNAYALSKLFDAPSRNKQPTKRDRAIASALRRLSHAGIAAYLASQIVAQEEGRLDLSKDEEMELREAHAECFRIRCDLVEALGLQADYDTSFEPVTKGKPL